MALKITKDDLDFVTSSIALVVMTPFLIMFGIDGRWNDFFAWLIIEVFFYVVTLFSDILP